MKKRHLLIFSLLIFNNIVAQQFNISTYRDLSIPYVETNPSHYDFIYPIYSDFLDSTHFSPPADGVYLKAAFGHRYFSTRTYRSDNHGGVDFWENHTYRGNTYNGSNKVHIVSMCDGYISQVLEDVDSIIDLTATGRSVRVTCDSSFQTLGFKIKINYRHLDSLGDLAKVADTAAFGSVRISKGDTIGLMGKSGTTSNIHLHLSTQTIHPIYGSAIVNTNRLFDPNKSPAALSPLKNAKIELLKNWSDSALFRVIWPYNQTINRFQFINQTDTVVFDKEDAYNTGSANRDSVNCLPNIRAYAYQFNGSQTAEARYLTEKNNIPPEYPASPNRDTNLTMYGYTHFPITEDSISYVYDFMVKNLSPTHQVNQFVVKVSDVWGYTVQGNYQNSSLSENKNLEIKVFPNPTFDKVKLTFNKMGSKQISLYTLSGKLLFTKESYQDNVSLNLKKYSNGVYLVKVKYDEEIKTIKLIKK